MVKKKVKRVYTKSEIIKLLENYIKIDANKLNKSAINKHIRYFTIVNFKEYLETNNKTIPKFKPQFRIGGYIVDVDDNSIKLSALPYGNGMNWRVKKNNLQNTFYKEVTVIDEMEIIILEQEKKILQYEKTINEQNKLIDRYKKYIKSKIVKNLLI